MRKSFATDEEVYFTSDLHFGHRAMVSRGWRPFADIDEMDAALIQNWNETITKHTHVFILGDFSFRPAARTLEIIAELNGIKFLILGNHDHLSDYALSLFDGVAPYHEIAYASKKFVLCHYPLRSWNNMHHGSWNLHGHSHGNIKERWRNQVDVGVDCWDFKPVSIEEILAMPQPEAQWCDHHQDKTARLEALRQLTAESEELGLYK